MGIIDKQMKFLHEEVFRPDHNGMTDEGYTLVHYLLLWWNLCSHTKWLLLYVEVQMQAPGERKSCALKELQEEMLMPPRLPKLVVVPPVA